MSNEPYPAGVEPDPASPSERHPDTPAPDPETSPWNVPNALTAFRIVLVPVFAWMLLAHPDEPGWRLLTAGVFTLAILTDSLDGYLARRHNLVTKFGKLADPIADKALTGTALICLSVIGELWWWATVVILVREWGITVLRFAMLRYGVMAAGRGGKIKTFVQAIAIILYLLPLAALAAWSPALAAVATWVAVAVMLAAVLSPWSPDWTTCARRSGSVGRACPHGEPQPGGPGTRRAATAGRDVATAESLTGGLLGRPAHGRARSLRRIRGRGDQLRHSAQGDPGRRRPRGPGYLGPVAGRTAAEMAAGVARRCQADWGWPPLGSPDRTRRTVIPSARCTSRPPIRRATGSRCGRSG